VVRDRLLCTCCCCLAFCSSASWSRLPDCQIIDASLCSLGEVRSHNSNLSICKEWLSTLSCSPHSALCCRPLCTTACCVCSAVRGMAVFQDLQMLVLAQSTGGLAALPMPTPYNGAVAAAGHAPSFAAVGVPASRTLPLGGGALPSGPGMPALHTWLPRVALIKAHKNGIEAASSLVSCQTPSCHSLAVGVCSACAAYFVKRRPAYSTEELHHLSSSCTLFRMFVCCKKLGRLPHKLIVPPCYIACSAAG
jgi:hypothetical protein